MSKTALIMAGGTGGHVFPALAVAQRLQDLDIAVSWLGTKKGLEAKVIPEAGIDIDWISINGLRGNGIFGWLLAPYKLMIAMLQAKKAINKRKPDFVLGMGGFAAGPGGAVAWLNGTPLVIPGMTNRLLSMVAKRVLQAFPGAFESSKNAMTIGNPIRESFFSIEPPKQRFANRDTNSFKLLVVGGSLGALAINQLVPEVIAELQKQIVVDVWHQTGSKHYEATQTLYTQHKVPGKITAFINDMAQAYAWADVVLCRSGALTVSELAAVGVGSVLVPYPHAVDDHQTKNGQFLVDAGAAIMIQQTQLDETRLVQLLSELANDRSKILHMAEAAYSARQINATDDVVKQCLEVANV